MKKYDYQLKTHLIIIDTGALMDSTIQLKIRMKATAQATGWFIMQALAPIFELGKLSQSGDVV